MFFWWFLQEFQVNEIINITKLTAAVKLVNGICKATDTIFEWNNKTFCNMIRESQENLGNPL